MIVTLFPRVYPIADITALRARSGAPIAFIEGLLEAGAGIVQLRHKENYSREDLSTARQVVALCLRAGAAAVINDRADIAAMLDAGLHVGQDDLPPAMARRVLGHRRRLGFSTHNAEQLRAGDSEPVDYLAIGPVFATGSKENPDPVVGVERLREIRALTAKPLVAIGGITRETAPQVWAAGVDSIAVIGDLLPAELSKAAVRERMEEWLSLSKKHS